ncbi:hypothetical protein DEDE109153_13105 [Deinococcus deserti]|uniref:Uncharacterized protein n=1 Tax=Deinococcus deserti (strain DSM 17065 / CIP 109153 / LMG 22923 / VCD115) TaxID=546414 RepID=X5GXX6_DEIDV|nr:hypothetical protein Deide_02802 [Deinococcus deserti VCD115]
MTTLNVAVIPKSLFAYDITVEVPEGSSRAAASDLIRTAVDAAVDHRTSPAEGIGTWSHAVVRNPGWNLWVYPAEGRRAVP